MFGLEGGQAMVVLIVLISVGAGTVSHYLKLKHARAEPADNADLNDMRREIGSLRERVKTLEQIVTDKDKVLAREINSL